MLESQTAVFGVVLMYLTGPHSLWTRQCWTTHIQACTGHITIRTVLAIAAQVVSSLTWPFVTVVKSVLMAKAALAAMLDHRRTFAHAKLASTVIFR